MSQKIRNLLITVYVLVILGISAAAKAEQTIFPVTGHNHADVQTYTGQLAVSVDDKVYLVVNDHTFYELAATQDLSELNGRNVQVDGIVITHKAGPVFELMSLDPLSIDEREHKVAPVLIVYKVSEISE
jgi:hypothetical protein